MAGILGLVGSGEFTKAMVDCDKFLLEKTSKPKVAILPTAAGEEAKYYKWIEDGVKHFKNLGTHVVGIPILTRQQANDPKMAKSLQEFNFYYFSGGNPGYLLDTIKNTKCWEVIYRKFLQGATLVGSSAGAMILGKMVWTRVYDFVAGRTLKPWEEGLGIVEFGILPHYDFALREFSKDDWERIKINLPKGIKIIGIDEDTVYVRISGKWKVIGEGKVHEIQ